MGLSSPPAPEGGENSRFKIQNLRNLKFQTCL